MARLRALRTTYGVYGLVNQGAEFTVSEQLAQQLEEKGIVERVWDTAAAITTKVLTASPENKDLGASPENKSHVRRKR